MEIARGRSMFVNKFINSKDKKVFVFYRRSEDENAPNQGVINYTDQSNASKGSWVLSIGLNEKQAEVFESFIGTDDATKKEVLQNLLISGYDEKGKEFDTAFAKMEDIYYGENKLADVRNKVTKKIDKVFGTNLEKMKLAKPLKKIEKAISDATLGKTR